MSNISFMKKCTVYPDKYKEWNLDNVVIIQFVKGCVSKKTEFYCDFGMTNPTACFTLWFLDSEGKMKCPRFIKKINVCVLVEYSGKRNTNTYIHGSTFINQISFRDSMGNTRYVNDATTYSVISGLTYINMNRNCYCLCCKVMDV